MITLPISIVHLLGIIGSKVNEETEVKGICFRDLADCIVKAFIDSVETTEELQDRANDGTLNYNDLYTLDLSRMDPVALLLNVCCRVRWLWEFILIF